MIGKYLAALTTFILMMFSPMLSALVHAQVRVEAIVGKPFGVARVTLPLGIDDQNIVSTNGYAIDDPTNRLFYPVFGTTRVVGIIRELAGLSPANAQNVSVFFLFTGDSPFNVTIRVPNPVSIQVVPEFRPRRHQRMLEQWWRQYNTVAREQVRRSDYPPIVETYLTTMLGTRLGFPLEPIDRERKNRTFNNDMIGVTLNLESKRIAAMRDAMLRSNSALGTTRFQIPPEPTWPVRTSRDLRHANVVVEPMASRVPLDCFYLRFGTFSNYLWLKRLLEENGGDIGRMITMRGHDTMLGQKSQQQLGLKESMLASVLGPRVVEDIALIGSDIYLREGASMGVLFKAKTPLLENDLMKQRKNAVDALSKKGAKIEDIQVAGRDVSFAFTPNNELRSFYVIDGEFHFVTNSRSLVERFLGTKDGKGSLAESAEFQTVRSELPADRDDAVFVHLSTEFFRSLLGNQYQIELRRRLASITEMELLLLARQAAKSEGLADTRVAALANAGFLRQGFGQRTDGSYLVEGEDHLYDSKRGVRGSFLPIPDMPVDSLSADEMQAMNEVAAFRQNVWHDADPLTLAIKRFSTGDKSLERIRVSARLLPFDRKSFGALGSMVGPPVTTEIIQPQDDIIRMQMSMQGGRIMASSPHTMFFGMRDANVPIDFGRSTFRRMIQILQQAPAYLGAWPKPGFLDRIPIANRLPIDADGMTRLPFGLWRWQSFDGSFSVLSFRREILAMSKGEFGVQPASSPAQFRLFVGDTTNAKIRPWLNSLNYWRAFETSIGNTRLLHTINQQLDLDLSATKRFAEDILSIKMTCPLNGDYELVEIQGYPRWTSSQWPGRGGLEVQDFRSPFAKWFRGVDARATVFDDRIVADALIDVHRDESAGGSLPIFDMFKSNPFRATDKGPKSKNSKPETIEVPEELPMPASNPSGD